MIYLKEKNEYKKDDFIKSIHRSAKESSQALEKEVQQYSKKQLKSANDEIHEKYTLKMNTILKEIKSETLKELTSYESKKRELLVQRRSYIEQKVFEEAKNRIISFSKSENYLPLLLKSAENIGKMIKTDAVLYIRECDISYTDKIKEAFSFPCTIKIDHENHLGGIMAVSSKAKLALDDRYASRLHEQKEQFRNNSKLSII